MKCYGILVVYYPNNRGRAETQFRALLGSLGCELEVIVVNNGDDIHPGDIIGDNSHMEFSGWDRGLQEIEVAEDDLLVFANDTFCVRHTWNVLVQRRYLKALHIVRVKCGAAICGEVSNFNQTYGLLGVSANFWIRTHLFALNGKAIKKLGKVSLSEADLNSMVSLDNDGRLVWSDSVSLNLRDRIDGWLYPASGEFGWYGAKLVSKEQKLKKARSILNEKWLSATCAENDVEVVDCSKHMLFKFIGRLRSKFNQVFLKR
ncbi:MAG: hypothetical protein V7746_19490 [Halioglobus sp.]